MYKRLENLLLEEISGAARAYRKFTRVLAAKRAKIHMSGKNTEEFPIYTKMVSRYKQAKEAIPKSEKRNKGRDTAYYAYRDFKRNSNRINTEIINRGGEI